jgi:uncharacterized protein (DUF924 family)
LQALVSFLGKTTFDGGSTVDRNSTTAAGKYHLYRRDSKAELMTKKKRKRYAPILSTIASAGCKSGLEIIEAAQPAHACDLLSLILLVDQFPRNCYRGEASAVVFKTFDPLARDIALAAVERRVPTGVSEIRWQFSYRQWFFMPLMHSELLAHHEQALGGFQDMLNDLETLVNASAGASATEEDMYRANAIKVVQEDVETARNIIELPLGFEQSHYDIIKQFGRYPHRNQSMQRTSTAQEKDYLEGGGQMF